MKKQIIGFLVFMVALSTVLSGCSSSEKTWTDGDGVIDGDLVFWTQQTEPWLNYFEPALKRFKEKYPEVNVKVEYFPEFADKVNQAFSAGEEPDVLQTWQSVVDWAKGGRVSQIPESVMSKSDFESLYYDAALKNKMHEGNYYAIPSEINVESPLLYVNMDILEKENISLPQGWVENNGPKDFAELLDFSNQLVKKDSNGNIIQSGLAYTYAQWEANFLSLILQYGGDYRDETNMKVNFKTPEAYKAAETLLRYSQGEEAICFDGEPRYTQFIQGAATMTVGAPWYAGSFAIDMEGVNIQIFNMPSWVEGADPISIGTGGWGYAVTEKSKNKEAAWAFVEFMTSSYETGEWAYITGAIPARRDSLQDLEYDPNVGDVNKAIVIAKEILPYAEEDGAYMQTSSTLIYTIIRGRLNQLMVDGDIDAFLQAIEDEGNAMIQENLSRQ